MKLLDLIAGNQNKKKIKLLRPLVEEISSFEPTLQALSDTEIKAKTAEFRSRLEAGETLDDILPEAFAVVREAGKRTLGLRHFDVQMMGGIVLHRGMIAEMRTGEGKTLVATLPTYLNALAGKGVHVVTVNDYLAKRDAVWMGQLYDFLGLSVGIIQNERVSFLYDASFKGGEEHGIGDTERDETGSFRVEDEFLRPCSRQDAYRADITYGTNNEFGFDYLRDNMVQQIGDMVMRPGSEMEYAIVDEVDSILIDEARTPLIISAPAAEAGELYYRFAQLVKQLDSATDYNVDEKMRSATLTETGITKIEKMLGIENLYVEGGIQLVHHLEQALKAEVLFKRDKDYLVDDGEVVIIDEFTGRKMVGRRYSEGLHQAIEAKEGVEIMRESQTLATITFQNLFRMYRKLGGMTGTAETEKEELYKIYALDVVVMPTNRVDNRTDHTDRIYKNEAGKKKAILEKIAECRAKNQPMLIGTISVEKNEELASYLEKNGVAFQMLNAKNHEREAEIIAQAGRPGAVTLATNMAGRGVDIKLGGNPINKEEEEIVKAAGGLFVLGTERHESRRIDNQLRGRSARQGDPGETQFFVSTEDDLMRIFAGDRMKNMMERLNVPEDMPIEQKMITRMLESAQAKVEGHNFDIRKHLLQYDDILNRQRTAIYRKRRQILELGNGQVWDAGEGETSAASLRDIILEMIEDEIEFVVSFHTNPDSNESLDRTEKEWNMAEIVETMRTIFPLSAEETSHILSLGKREEGKMGDVDAREAIISYLFDKAKTEYDRIENSIREASGEATAMRDVEKNILLRSIDTLWVDHLIAIDHLRKSIGLQGYAQRDPLIEYKRQTFDMYHALEAAIQKEVVYSFFKVGAGLSIAPSIMATDKLTLAGAAKTAVDATGGTPKVHNTKGEKIGRNDLVTITNGTATKEMKFKKAEPLIESGVWKIVS